MIISQSFMRKVTLRSVWHLYITADQYGNRLYTVANVYQIFRNRRYLQRKIVRKVTLQFYRHSIFTKLQFEILSLKNIIFSLFQTRSLVYRLQQAEKSVSNWEKSQFIKLDISNWRTAEIKCR